MADRPTRAYCVALAFLDGPMIQSTTIAPDPTAAVALAAVDAGRVTDKPLNGYGVMELSAEWLRRTLRAMESGDNHKAPVVSLVSDNLRPAVAGDPERLPTEQETLDQLKAAAEYSRHLMPPEPPESA